MGTTHTRVTQLVATATATLLLAACTGSDEDTGAEQPSAPPEVSAQETSNSDAGADAAATSDQESPATQEQDDPEEAAPTVTVTETAEEEAPESTGSPEAPSGTTPEPEPAGDPACGEESAQEALTANLSKVPTKDTSDGHTMTWTWTAEGADTSHYDACAALSAITVHPQYGTGSSPDMIMLFHRGEYLGTATAHPVGMGQEITRRSDEALDIAYLYPKPGESNAMRSGRALSTVTWDEAEQKVVMTGDLPPYEDEELPGRTDGDPTSGSTTRASVVVDGVARILTPSGNIGCEIAEEAAECGVESYLRTEPYGRDEGDFTRWWIVLPSEGRPFIRGKSDAPNYRGENGGPSGQVLEYGTSVRHGQVTCHSAETGLTCENAASGHSVTMNKKGYTVR